MRKTEVVNLIHEEYDIYIGRGGRYGNPFHIGRHGNREEVIRKYREWIVEKPDLMEKAKVELKGKRLGCFCAPLACHGDVLREIVDS